MDGTVAIRASIIVHIDTSVFRRYGGEKKVNLFLNEETSKLFIQRHKNNKLAIEDLLVT